MKDKEARNTLELHKMSLDFTDRRIQDLRDQLGATKDRLHDLTIFLGGLEHVTESCNGRTITYWRKKV